MEIERKFLVNKDFDLTKYCYEVENIIQAYISIEPETRIRAKNENYKKKKKSQGDLVREETETKIDKQTFDILKKLSIGRIITKTRYKLKYGKHTIELDCFHDNLEGLVMAEVEFASLEEAKIFESPVWFEEEVTHDKRYKNKNLATMDLELLKTPKLTREKK